TQDDIVLALTIISFDPAVLDIFLPLSVGARVVIAPETIRADAEQIVALLASSGATILQATPTTWQLLIEKDWSRKSLKALIGGEILTPDLAREILNRCGELWNVYGPTEATVWSTIGRIEHDDEIHIGRPIANQRVYVVDRHNQLVPVGVPGEVLISGAGVARAYSSQPELTANSFVTNPFSSSGGRVYRTGDFCRYQPNGNLQFLGRKDHQIKIRGFRVELGEIQTAALEHPAVRQCVVINRPDRFGHQRLLAYLVLATNQPEPDIAELRRFLQKKLPDYMVPAAFIILSELPLTASGKVDRKLLPEPLPTKRASIGEAQPRNSIERKVARIWEDILHVEGISIDDDFFEIGGHSLLAVRLIAQTNAAFGIHLPLVTIFRSPTVAGLALAVQDSEELEKQSPGLILSHRREREPIIFWAPSIGSLERFVECYNLARLLRGRYCFHGFDPAPQFQDIGSLARHCVDLIRTQQPHGPYVIAGYCHCGHVAHEIARRLENDGEQIELL
ncbi:MAG TPA: AMP-binding protein, partial [Chthoniobacterales bacterium]